MPDVSSFSGVAWMIVAGVPLLGILVFIHEAGHYLVAKALGIRVEVFSLGFGPRLTGFERGGTEYRVSAIPLGGYVKMLGENPEEALRGSREEFLSRSRFERFLVLVMGASLNIVLAILVNAGIHMHGVTEPRYEAEPPVVGWLDPNGAAAEADLHVRDRILAVGGKEVSTWREMQIQVALNPNKEIPFEIRRDEQARTVNVKVRERPVEPIGVIGIGPLSHYSVRGVVAGGAADRAGLQPGDEIISVEGRELFLEPETRTFNDLIASSAGRPVAFKVQRGDRSLELDVTPDPGEGKLEIGVMLWFAEGTLKYAPAEALERSVRECWQNAGVLLISLKKVLTLEMSAKTLSGPITIFRMAGASLQIGWIPFFHLLWFMSLQLGIINLLPIPILDGGHIFIIFIEGLIRRDLSVKIKERVMQFGFILLLLIMGGVISMDVYKNFFVQ